MLETLPLGIIAFPGSGITENLTDKARKMAAVPKTLTFLHGKHPRWTRQLAPALTCRLALSETCLQVLSVDWAGEIVGCTKEIRILIRVCRWPAGSRGLPMRLDVECLSTETTPPCADRNFPAPRRNWATWITRQG
jgi:hypothetical protein